MTSEAPVRIAFCITDLDAGGAERAMVQLVTRLDRARFEPMVFCLSQPGELVGQLEQAGVPTVCLGARSRFNLWALFRLNRALRAFRPRVLQTYLHHANIAGRIAGRLAGVEAIVCGIRVAEKRSRVPLWLDRWTGRLVTRHVCVSRDVAEFSKTRGRLLGDKLTVIPNGVDAELFASAAPADLNQFDIPADAKTVLFVGRLDPQKGPFILLAAVEGVVRAHPEFHLLIVGDGPLRAACAQWVKAHGLSHHVHFAGRRSDVPSLMRASHCLAVPSLWEGMANVVLEAMAAGLPVIATSVEGTSELIQNHVTGLLISPGSPQELAGALTLVLTDPVQAGALGRAAQVFVSEKFTWNTCVERYERLYQGLLLN